MAAPDYPTFVLDAIRKEVKTQYSDTDMLSIGETTYSKRQLLYALDTEDPLLLGYLSPSMVEVEKNPSQRQLALLYLSGKSPTARPVRSEYTEQAIYLLSEEVSKFPHSATLYIDEVEYPKNTLLMALRERDPALMSHIEPLSKRILQKNTL